LKIAMSGNKQFRKLMALAHWSGAETARRLGVSEASISAYVHDNQTPPPAKLKLLRLMVDHFMNYASGSEHPLPMPVKPVAGLDPPSASAGGAAQKKSLREIRLEALVQRIEALAAGLRSFESAEEKVEAAEELADLATELAAKLQTPVPPKGKG
jgi:transcriptional regulator with XRE-family HTH domain